MFEFKMPSLGAEMEAGRLVEWRVKVGDHVKRGDIVAVVDTDKAAVDVEIWESGTVDQIRVPTGGRVPIGTVLATLRSDAEEKAPSAPEKPTVRTRVSPAAKRRAQELSVSLDVLSGTGPEGSITSGDVEKAASLKRGAKPPEPAAEHKKEAMRAAIGAAMAKSKREIPHYYLATQIDLKRAIDWLSAENAKRALPDRILAPVLLFKAVAKALGRVPELNGIWREGEFYPNQAVNIGVAISLRGGLVAPALHDVEKKTLSELMRDLNDLVTRARAGSLKSSELSDATITVTNLGDQGVETVFGVIYPPQVALVGFGKVTEIPWVVDGSVGIRPVVRASLSADHRVSDGHRGAVFLSTLDQILQEPMSL